MVPSSSGYIREPLIPVAVLLLSAVLLKLFISDIETSQEIFCCKLSSSFLINVSFIISDPFAAYCVSVLMNLISSRLKIYGYFCPVSKDSSLFLIISI